MEKETVEAERKEQELDMEQRILIAWAKDKAREVAALGAVGQAVLDILGAGPKAIPTLETEEVVRRFLESKRQNLAEASLATYSDILATFGRAFPYLPTAPEPIEHYLAQRPSFKSRELIYIVLSQLYDFANKRLGALNVMQAIARPPKGKRKEADYLSKEQVKAIMEVINIDTERALFYLYAGQGFRRSEAVRININDIQEDRIKVHGKEGDEWMPLLPEVKEVLLRLASGRAVGPVFMSQRGERLGDDMAAEYIRRLFKRAGITGVKPSPHTLRHTFCTLMQADGCDRYLVELLLRHRTQNVTDIYSHLSIEQRLQLMRSKLEQFSPIRLANGKAQNIPINSNLRLMVICSTDQGLHL